MAYPSISAQHYEALVALYREQPANHLHAERSMKLLGLPVSRPTCRKAWLEGYPNETPPRRAIKDIVIEEQAATRASFHEAIGEASSDVAYKMAEAEARRLFEERERARLDVVSSRRTEAKIVRDQRANIGGLVSGMSPMIDAVRSLCESLKKDIAKASSRRKLDAKAKMNLIERGTRVIKGATDSVQTILQTERLLLGEPTEILGTKNLGDLTEEDAIKELEEAGKVAARHKERLAKTGTLHIIDGGRVERVEKKTNGVPKPR